MAFFACKLPHGLSIRHGSTEIILRGANIGEDLQQVSRNGSPNDNATRAFSYGITEVPDDLVEPFNAWVNSVTYKEGKRENGKLADPFPALDNGSILGPFKTRGELLKEVAAVAGGVKTGFEGLDPAAEAKKAGGVEENKDKK